MAVNPIPSVLASSGRPVPAQAAGRPAWPPARCSAWTPARCSAWPPAWQSPAVLASLLLALCATLLCAPGADAAGHPRKPKPIVEIVAAGKVVNGAAPAAGAVVYLENPTSLAIKSYLTGPNGGFHFNNLSPQTDYEVWAELNGVQSKHRFISQFSNHTKFDFTLKLETKKKRKLLGIL